MCWHKWSKWEVIHNELIRFFNQYNRDLPVYRIKVFIQQKQCEKCGLSKFNKKQVKY